MYKPKTIRLFSLVAIVLSALSLLLSGVMMTQANGMFFVGVLSVALLLWASIIGYQLSSYPLNEDDCKKLGLRVYLILAAVAVFMFAGVVGGLVVSTALLSSLWGMKKNYDEWDGKSAR